VNIFVPEWHSGKHVVPAGMLILERSRKHFKLLSAFRSVCCCFLSSAIKNSNSIVECRLIYLVIRHLLSTNSQIFYLLI